MTADDVLRAEARRLAAEYGPLKDLAAALPRILAEAWNEGWAAREHAEGRSPRRLREQLEHASVTRRLADLAARYGAVAAAHPARVEAARPDETTQENA